MYSGINLLTKILSCVEEYSLSDKHISCLPDALSKSCFFHMFILNGRQVAGKREVKRRKNKPDRTTMRPGCVYACIEDATYMERQMKRHE